MDLFLMGLAVGVLVGVTLGHLQASARARLREALAATRETLATLKENDR